MSDSMNRTDGSPDDRERPAGGDDERPEGLDELDRLLAGMGTALASRAERRERRRALLLRWMPTAAVAAGVVLLAFAVPWRGGPDREPPPETPSADWDVEAPGAFAVFPTSDENVVVIWLLNED